MQIFIQKDSTYAYLAGVTLLDMENAISVVAHSKGGTTFAYSSFNLSESYTSFWGKHFVCFIIIAGKLSVQNGSGDVRVCTVSTVFWPRIFFTQINYCFSLDLVTRSLKMSVPAKNLPFLSSFIRS